MSLKSLLSRPIARISAARESKKAGSPHVRQERLLQHLLKRVESTAFGRDHGLQPGMTLAQYQVAVPVRDYEGLKPWMDKAVKGEADVLWPGRPDYFCKTSGTTSGAKFIPITPDSMPNHIGSARNALLQYIHNARNARFVDGKMIFLQGSPELSKTAGGILMGRLSGIVAHHVPDYLQANRQDQLKNPGLRLNVDDGIFYEFIPADEYFEPNRRRLGLHEVEMGVQYALIISSNAGLWAYDIGDTIKFVSSDPYRIVVTGRIKHFTSAFGEHVIAEEVEGAVQAAMKIAGGVVAEFHVAPEVSPAEGLPFHEWFVEFSEEPSDVEAFAKAANEGVLQRNPYYRDLISGAILQTAKLRVLQKGTFHQTMANRGKLGGQNKPPRLANGRDFASELERADTTLKRN